MDLYIERKLVFCVIFFFFKKNKIKHIPILSDYKNKFNIDLRIQYSSKQNNLNKLSLAGIFHLYFILTFQFNVTAKKKILIMIILSNTEILRCNFH